MPKMSKRSGPSYGRSVSQNDMDFIEFHPSMSLANISVMDFHSPPHVPSNTTPFVNVNEATSCQVKMEDVLTKRFETWDKTSKLIENIETSQLAPTYQQEIEKLKKLKELHNLCRYRENHLRMCHLGLLQERKLYSQKIDALKDILTKARQPDREGDEVEQADETHKAEVVAILDHVLSPIQKKEIAKESSDTVERERMETSQLYEDNKVE